MKNNTESSAKEMAGDIFVYSYAKNKNAK